MAKESYERPVMTVILLSGTNVVLTSCVINLCNTNEDEESCFGYMGQGMCGGYENAGLCPAICMDTGDTCENFPCEGTDGGGGGYCDDFGCSSDEGFCSAYNSLPCEDNPGGGWCSSDY